MPRTAYYFPACDMEGGRAPSLCPSVRASVRPSVRPRPFWDPKKRSKPFKINGFGVFLGSSLGRWWARTRFFDPPLVAQLGRRESMKNVVKPM